MNSYILSVSLLSALFLFTPTTTEVAHVAEAHGDEKVAIVERVSREMDFDPQIVKNVIDTETGGTWDCTLVGAVGELGCFQIRPEMHDVDPLNFEDSTRYFISAYKNGYEHWWTGCNCYGFVSTSLELPRMAQILPNSAPYVGAVAIFEYPQKHIAIVEKLTEDGFVVRESNKEPCKISTREVMWNDLRLVGFYTPTTSPETVD